MVSSRRYAQLGILSAAMILCLSLLVLLQGREGLRPAHPLEGIESLTPQPMENQVVLGGASTARFTP
jgi:hypothetical protein